MTIEDIKNIPLVRSPTMTIHDCAEAFRANQIPISEDKLAAGIDNGLFPFAVPLSGSERCPIIFRQQFYSWLKTMLMQEEVIEI